MRRAARRRISRATDKTQPSAGLFDFGDACLDQLRHERIGKRLVSGKLDRALGLEVRLELRGMGFGDAAAYPVEGVVRLPVFEVDDGLAVELEPDHAVVHPLRAVRRGGLDLPARVRQRRALFLR